uniref:SRCR domain-containing protein n=1 Tax=Amphimedon queenslandica TaxID=400682 RepID=A0A1X7UHB6_AMPQE
MNKTSQVIRLGIILILSSFAIYSADAQSCNVPGVSLYSNVTAVSNGQELVSGVAVWCWNGEFVSLCDEDDSFGNDDANLVCTSKGFNSGIVLLSPNMSLYATLPQPSMYYSNLTCPPNAVNTGSCTVTPSADQFCINGTRNIYIQCSRPAPTSTVITTSTTSSFIMTTSTSTVGSTSSSTRSTNTPSSTPDGSQSLDVRFIASVATGGAVLLLIIIVIVVFIIIAVCIYKRGPKKPKEPRPVEMSGFHN